MRTYNLDDIRTLDPCYDPTRYVSEDWTGTLVDILRAEQVPVEDRLWVVTGLLDDRTNRLFAVWCARQALALIDNPDPRNVAVCNVAERYAIGDATSDELAAAWDAAWAAAWDAVGAAAWDAVGAAAGDAARDAAWDAARDAARAAAWDAARAAARDAVGAAAGDAARDAAWAAARYAAWAAAGDAAWAAAWAAARDAQIDHLIEMIQEA